MPIEGTTEKWQHLAMQARREKRGEISHAMWNMLERIDLLERRVVQLERITEIKQEQIDDHAKDLDDMSRVLIAVKEALEHKEPSVGQIDLVLNLVNQLPMFGGPCPKI